MGRKPGFWVQVDELGLGVFERKILRRIYGPICEGVTWISRYNEELYRLYDETDLVTSIRITRLRWAGHIYECKIIYHVRKSPWIKERAEGEWEGQILDGWIHLYIQNFKDLFNGSDYMPVSSNDKDHQWLTICEGHVKMRSCLIWRASLPLLWRNWGRPLETCQGNLVRDRYTNAEACNAKRWTTHAEAVKISCGRHEVLYGGVEIQSHASVTSALEGDKWLAQWIEGTWATDRQILPVFHSLFPIYEPLIQFFISRGVPTRKNVYRPQKKIVNCRTKISAIFRGIFKDFSRYLESFYLLYDVFLNIDWETLQMTVANVCMYVYVCM
jgi:hypothetical protein